MGNLNVPLLSGSFSQRKKDWLVTQLLDFQAMKERIRRDRIVEGLSFADSIQRTPDTTNRQDVLDIVNGCLNFSDDGDGLQQLIDRIKFHENNSPRSLKLNASLKFLFFSPEITIININSLIKLYKLTSDVQVTKDDLRNLYYQSLPDSQQNSEYKIDNYKNLHHIISNLAQIGRQEVPFQSGHFTHPLLTFAKLLSQKIPDSSVGSELLQWQEETARTEKLVIMEDIIDLAIQYSYYLLVIVEPDLYGEKNKPQKFYIKGYFVREYNKQLENLEVPGLNKEEACLLDAISPFINEWIYQCETKMLHFQEYTNITIEFFLPFDLLACTNERDLHKWIIKDTFDNETPIGRKYPVVVRSYDRVYKGREPEMRAWIRNWNSCQIHECCIDKQKLEENKFRLLKEMQYQKEKDDLQISLQEVVCLRMTFVPPKYSTKSPHLFPKMIGAGTAIALWLRDQDPRIDEDTIDQEYQALLSESSFLQLPEIILKKRIDNKDSFANSITLFWDNPHRFPPDAPLRPDKVLFAAPKQRK